MPCEVFCGLGQVAVIDRRQCIQHNGLLIDIAQLAASMISELSSYGITASLSNHVRLFSTFNLRNMCQIVSVKSSFKVGDLRSAKDPLLCRCFGGGRYPHNHGSASITCGSSSSDFTSSSRGPGWLKPGPSTSDHEPSSPNSHQRSDVWLICRFPKGNSIIQSLDLWWFLDQYKQYSIDFSDVPGNQGPDQQPAGFLLRQLDPEAARRTRPGFSGGWDLPGDVDTGRMADVEKRLMIWRC